MYLATGLGGGPVEARWNRPSLVRESAAATMTTASNPRGIARFIHIRTVRSKISTISIGRNFAIYFRIPCRLPSSFRSFGERRGGVTKYAISRMKATTLEGSLTIGEEVARYERSNASLDGTGDRSVLGGLVDLLCLCHRLDRRGMATGDPGRRDCRPGLFRQRALCL